MDKTCTKCGKTKPTTEYVKDRGNKTGLFSWCKTCQRAQMRKWRSLPASRERERESRRSPQRKAYDALYKRSEKYRERERARYASLREAAIVAYGGICECCREANPAFLTIDHANRDGAKHRREVGSGRPFMTWLRRNGFPKRGFRLLCFNCNHASWIYGQCPHLKLPEG